MGAKEVHSHYRSIFSKLGGATAYALEDIFELHYTPYENFSPHHIAKVNPHAGKNAYSNLLKSSALIKNIINSEHHYPNHHPNHHLAGGNDSKVLSHFVALHSVALVTLPVNKAAIQMTQPNFVGHTEFLAEQFGRAGKVSMTFFSPFFNLVLTTTHQPLASVPASLTEEKLIKAINHALEIKNITNNPDPLIVLGLNPHAGENGILGSEEEIIKKVIKENFSEQSILGPVSPDTAFYQLKKNSTVLAHYHDQGLIPLKTLALHQATNVTWGLPFVRTSVSHGTAYDVVGKNKADPNSFYQALSLAFDIIS